MKLKRESRIRAFFGRETGQDHHGSALYAAEKRLRIASCGGKSPKASNNAKTCVHQRKAALLFTAISGRQVTVCNMRGEKFAIRNICNVCNIYLSQTMFNSGRYAAAMRVPINQMHFHVPCSPTLFFILIGQKCNAAEVIIRFDAKQVFVIILIKARTR